MVTIAKFLLFVKKKKLQKSQRSPNQYIEFFVQYKRLKSDILLLYSHSVHGNNIMTSHWLVPFFIYIIHLYKYRIHTSKHIYYILMMRSIKLLNEYNYFSSSVSLKFVVLWNFKYEFEVEFITYNLLLAILDILK